MQILCIHWVRVLYVNDSIWLALLRLFWTWSVKSEIPNVHFSSVCSIAKLTICNVQIGKINLIMLSELLHKIITEMQSDVPALEPCCKLKYEGKYRSSRDCTNPHIPVFDHVLTQRILTWCKERWVCRISLCLYCFFCTDL